MAAIDIKQIVADAVALAKNEIGRGWKKIEPYAEHEFSQFTASVEFITKLHISGKIDADEFKARIDFQKTALNNVLRAIEGIGLITAQNTVNGIFDIVRTALQSATGLVFPL